MPLAAGFGLFLRELSHFLFQVPYLPLHSLVLLFLPVFCSYVFISLLRHLFEVLFKATHQALRMWSQRQIRSPPQFYYLLSIYMKYNPQMWKTNTNIQYRNRPAAALGTSEDTDHQFTGIYSICIHHSLKPFFYIRHTGIISPPSVWSESSHILIWSPLHEFWLLVDTRETFRPWTVPGIEAGSVASGAGGGTYINTVQRQSHEQWKIAPWGAARLVFHLCFSICSCATTQKRYGSTDICTLKLNYSFLFY